jgi:hypothetical protein
LTNPLAMQPPTASSFTGGIRMSPASPILKAWIAVAGLSLAALGHAGQGLAPPNAEAVWPSWQARISLQSAAPSDLRLVAQLAAQQRAAEVFGTAGHSRGVQGGALFGDYYFARPMFGSFRASGGFLVGAAGGAPAASGLSGVPTSRLGLVVSSGGVGAPPVAESNDTVPYLGLGYSGSWWRDRISLSADLGWVSERPAAASGVSRALFGNQGMNQALRDMRLSPLFQLGVNYSF